MQLTQDLLQAKQVLSARLLRAGLRGNVTKMGRALRVREAVSAAGRNVHAVGVGLKVVDGEVTEQPCVRIFVVQKLANSLLPPRDQLPAAIDGIPTDVIESPPAFILRKTSVKKRPSRGKARGESVAAQSCTDQRRARQSPVVAGISAAHQNVTAGTISYFCRSTRLGDDPGKVYVLSNNHVFADVNNAQPGDNLFQPGPADGAVPGDHFAELHRFVEIFLGGATPNSVDAAIGELLPAVQHRLEICRIGRISGTSRAIQGMRVRKHGRTTGLTEGMVTDPTYDALVGMSHTDPSIVAAFADQMRIERVSPFSAFGLGGDSGSLIVERSNQNAVGLYFAGPDSGEYGIANHIDDVLSELEIELL